MKALIQSAMAGLFGLITKEDHNFEVQHAILEEKQKNREQREQLNTLCIEVDIGTAFISVTNEWDNPIIGIVLGVVYVTAGNCPIALVYDFISNQVVLCGNARLPYTDYNLDAVLKLDPYQRWNLIARSSLEPSKSKYKDDCLDAEGIKSILKDRNINKVLQELSVVHHKEQPMKTQNLIQRVRQVLLSNNLNVNYQGVIE